MANPAQSALQQSNTLRKIKGLFAPRYNTCEPFSTVNFGQVATLELKEASTIQTLEIVTNVKASRISRISFEYQDGSEFSTTTPAFLQARDSYLKNKIYDVANGDEQTRLYIDFADETLRTTDGIRRGELVVGMGEIIRVKLHIGQRVNGDPEVLQLSANLRQTSAQSGRFFVSRLSTPTVNHTVIGEQTHKFPLMGQNHRIRRMWLHTGAVEYFEILRDRVKVIDGTVKDYHTMLERMTRRTVPDGWVCIDFIAHGFASESAFVPVANESLQLKLRTNADETIPVVFEYLTQVNQIPTQ